MPFQFRATLFEGRVNVLPAPTKQLLLLLLGRPGVSPGVSTASSFPPPQLLSNRIHREGWSIVGVTHVFLSKAFGCVVVPPGGQSAPQKGALQGGSGDGAGGAGRSPRTYSTSFLEGT